VAGYGPHRTIYLAGIDAKWQGRQGFRVQAVQEGRRPDWPCAARPLICIVPIFVVTAVFFANAIAASDLGFFDFRIVAMAKIRPPLITEAIHISDPSPCIQVLRPGFG
jgi:hypothetical protein